MRRMAWSARPSAIGSFCWEWIASTACDMASIPVAAVSCGGSPTVRSGSRSAVFGMML